MRVGQAFSRVLDPSKAPLFSDLGDLCLLPEEAWHRDCLPKAGSTPGTPTKPPQTLTAEPARHTPICHSLFLFHACQKQSLTEWPSLLKLYATM